MAAVSFPKTGTDKRAVLTHLTGNYIKSSIGTRDDMYENKDKPPNLYDIKNNFNN